MSTDTLAIVTMNIPRQNKPLITFAKGVHDHLKDNASFPSPIPTLAVFAADIDALDDAETKAATKAEGAVEARDAKKRKVKEDLRHLRNYVQSVVDAQANYRNAAALVTSAFLSIKKPSRHQRDEISAKNTGVSGTVELDARAVAPTATYFWQYSLDQQTWTSAPATMKARLVIAGLTPAKTYHFRFHALTRAGEVGFSQIVSLIVT